MTKTIKIIGIQDYKTQLNGNEYSGKVIHCIYEDEYVTGTGVIKFSVSDYKLKDLPNVKVGDEYKAVYTKDRNNKDRLECLL